MNFVLELKKTIVTEVECETAEGAVEKAKIEINAYATNMVMRTGLNLLGQNTPVVQLIADQEKLHGQS